MATPTYQIFAIKYAHVGRKAWGNFVDGDPHEDWDMPLDYYVWAVVGDGRTFVVDTGFDAPMAKKRDRKIVHPVEQGLEAVGIRHADVKDVVITHMHYDHCGNGALFPNARFHMQDTEMEYVTGRCMCHHQINHAFEPEDVSRMVYRVFAGHVVLGVRVVREQPDVVAGREPGHTLAHFIHHAPRKVLRLTAPVMSARLHLTARAASARKLPELPRRFTIQAPAFALTGGDRVRVFF